MPFFLLLLVVALLVIALIPVSIVQRYRMGTSRRLARGWVASLNVATLTLSIALVLFSAAVTSAWIPQAFAYTLAGIAAGCVLGLLGLLLSRWEASPQSLHYTPNRWLVLGLTLIVTARIFYGFWRAWQTWQTASDSSSWLAASGAEGSMAAGATVLGYYVTYWIGIRRRISAHRGRMTE